MRQVREFWKGYAEMNEWIGGQKEIRVVQIQPLFIPGYGVVYIVEYEIANAFIEKISSKK